MAGALSQEIDRLLSELAQRSDLTLATIRAAVPAELSACVHQKEFGKALLERARDYRARVRLGRLRAAILAGTALVGTKFLRGVERSGLLLSGDQPTAKFGAFLGRLQKELAGAGDAEFRLVHDRLVTYCAYHRLAAAVEESSRPAVSLLRTWPRWFLKNVLGLASLAFLARYLGFEMDHDAAEWLKTLGTPEDVASIASLLVARANEVRPVDSADLGPPLSGDLLNSEVRTAMTHGKAACLLRETAQFVSLFGYRLTVVREAVPRVFLLQAPSPEFEYAWRLGYVRAEMGTAKVPFVLSREERRPKLSLVAVAEDFANRFHDKLAEVRDPGTPFRRVCLHIPIIPDLYKRIWTMDFYEDAAYRERLAQEFLVPLRLESEERLRLSSALDLGTFYNLWRLLEFLSLVDIMAVRRYHSDRTLLHSCLVRVWKEEDLFDLAQQLGITREQARDFFNLVAADVRRLDYYDAQYRPLLRIAPNVTQTPEGIRTTDPEVIHLPALVHFSNVLRNVQVANRIRFGANPKAFVEVVADMLRSKFARVRTNCPVSGTRRTDIDVVLMEGGTLYLFECKHSVPATDPHELRDLWEDIERGGEQLRTAMEALSDPNRLRGYLGGWFPGTKANAVAALRLQPCVLSSHRQFAGLEYDGIPVRDFSSLALLFGDATLSTGWVDENGESIACRHRIVGEHGVTAADLDDYLRPNARYFGIFRPFMRSLTRTDPLLGGSVVLARDTYEFQTELGDMLTHLDFLGFARLPDERRHVGFPLSAEDLTVGDESQESNGKPPA